MRASLPKRVCVCACVPYYRSARVCECVSACLAAKTTFARETLTLTTCRYLAFRKQRASTAPSKAAPAFQDQVRMREARRLHAPETVVLLFKYIYVRARRCCPWAVRGSRAEFSRCFRCFEDGFALPWW